MKNIFSNKYLRSGLFVAGGLFLGWLLFHTPKVEKTEKSVVEEQHTHEIWTCSMDPQIRQDKPGKCPICGMDLIPLKPAEMTMDSDAIQLSDEAMQLANVETSVVTRENPEKQIRLYGKVQADERLLQNQVTQFAGRIDKLLVNFTGESVKKGQLLAVIYSPELITTQQEFIEAAKVKDSQPEIYKAARQKLRQWLLTDQQIAQIEKSGQTKSGVEIYSNTSGVITKQDVKTGDYVSRGALLYEVADLSKVWILFDAYEDDLAFLKIGDVIHFTLKTFPGKTFSANIKFIDPVVDAEKRITHVRVEIPNPQGTLKPEMFATGVVKAKLNSLKDALVIPRSAVLWTGKRSVIYVKEPGEMGTFKMRQIELGPALGNSYVVLDGLEEGEEIVTNGTFNIDAAAQLEGKPNMMSE
ncbi:MAG: efflux RND transporter periplasmic adaptor subunit [Paludibacter sp.]|nr:efflux RND transporter periplasmic adaptor subunit [Paludibacter sp.]